MSVRIADNQIELPANPSKLDHGVSWKVCGRFRSFVQTLDLNLAAPADLSPLAVPSTLFIPTACLVYAATGNMAAATLGLYTEAAAGGVEIVAPTLLASLTAAGKFQMLTIAALTDPIAATSLFPRLTVASGVAGGASLMLEYIDLQLA